jgi:hypothetical protein
VLDHTISRINHEHQLRTLSTQLHPYKEQRKQHHQPINMQFTKLAMALFAATVLAAPAASPVDVDDSLATATISFNFPTGAAGPVPQDCCLKASWHGVSWGCGKKRCGSK